MSISVRELITCLQRMESSKAPSPKRRRRRRARGNKNVVATPGTSGFSQNQKMQPLPPRGRRRRKTGNGGGSIVSGEVSFQRSEYLTDVTISAAGTANASFLITPLNFSWLKNLAQAFERMKWQYCHFEYRPSVGANTDGNVAFGFDWSNDEIATLSSGFYGLTSTTVTKTAVLACVPSSDGPVWSRPPPLVVPASRLQSRLWYDIPKDADTLKKSSVFDIAPGSLLYSATGAANKVVGELWVKYHIVMSGTRQV